VVQGKTKGFIKTKSLGWMGGVEREGKIKGFIIFKGRSAVLDLL